VTGDSFACRMTYLIAALSDPASNCAKIVEPSPACHN
jgi:hypothetical protein